MLNTLSFLRVALKRHGLWLLAACIAVLALQFVAVSWLVLGDRGYPWQVSRWGVFAIVLPLSVALGLVLLAWLHRSVMLPASRIADDMEQLLDRARLMPSAMQPALDGFGDSIERQGQIVDSLRQRVDTARSSMKRNGDGSAKDDEKRHAFFVSLLNNLCVEMASRREIAHTLVSAAESADLRLRELESALAHLRSVLSLQSLPEHEKASGKGWFGVIPDENNGSSAFDEEELPASFSEPTARENLSSLWSDEYSKPLMPEFKFTDETTKRRFQMH
ncbi:MAG: hypothetical protein WC378_06685 [Opitutaceae bacterium]